MTVQNSKTLKSPQFVLELIALTALNIIAVASGKYSEAILVDAAILGYHIGMQ